jgi:hypothetical protein
MYIYIVIEWSYIYRYIPPLLTSNLTRTVAFKSARFCFKMRNQKFRAKLYPDPVIIKPAKESLFWGYIAKCAFHLCLDTW